MFKPHFTFFLIVLCWTLVRADYTIDDSNYSVLKFSENPAGPVWGPFGSDTGEVLEIRLPNGTMQTVDATQCYDGTYTYAACSASNNCAVQFSFTGSGITIYVLQAGPQGMTASLSIDSGSPTTATLPAPSPPQYYIPRVPLFSIQNIPSGSHSAVMTVQDWNGGFSGMMLDYIDVNQAQVAGSTANPSPSPSPSSNPNPSPSSTPVQSPSSAPASTNSQAASSSQTSSGGTQTNSQLAAIATSAAIISIHSSLSPGATAFPSSSSSGSGDNSSASLSSSKKTNIAAIVGGVVGGVVGLLALIALALLYFRRQRRRQYLERLNERPSPLLPEPESRFTNANVGTFTTDPFGSSSALATGGPSGRPLQSWTDTDADSPPDSTARDASNPSRATDFSHSRLASSGNESVTPSGSISVGVATAAAALQNRDASTPAPAASAAVPVTYPSEKLGPIPGSSALQHQPASADAPDTPSANAILTDDQADFVNSLFNNNVPAPVVARVLERMLANPQGAGITGYNDPELRSHLNPGNSSSQVPVVGATPWRPTMSFIGDGETTTGTAPPSYDYARGE